MKLFKMKSLQGDGFMHVLDMIIFERLYLSTCRSMNDISEGRWCSQNRTEQYRNLAKRVIKTIEKQRFTCFIESVNNPLMWAHYAGGFKGVALEYDLDPELHDIRKIEYSDVLEISMQQLEQIATGEKKPQDTGILKTKETCWKYEKEWRLYGNSDDEYLVCTKPKSVIFGVGENLQNNLIREIINRFEIRVGYLTPVNGVEYEITYISIV